MRIHTLAGAVLLGLLYTGQGLAQTSPDAALDTFYSAGMVGNQAGVIAVLAPDAVFLGVAGKPRLQGQELRDALNESIASGSRWNYLSSERVVRQSVDGSVAWFDERLADQQLGNGRASGVLLKNGEVWQIAQYNLTLPLPDALTGSATGTPGAAATATPQVQAPQEPECRKTRHKTNKRARC